MITSLIKDFLRSKISVTIVTPPPAGVNVVYTPTVISPKPVITRKNHSSFRFMSLEKFDGGSNVTYYYTQVYKNGSWRQVEGSWFRDKNEAMKAHLAALKNELVVKEDVTTILWEGLDLEEAKTFVALQIQ